MPGACESVRRLLLSAKGELSRYSIGNQNWRFDISRLEALIQSDYRTDAWVKIAYTTNPCSKPALPLPPMTQSFFQTFILLLLVTDPFGNVPLFVSALKCHCASAAA
jgi:hypothetical protein